MSNLSTCLIWTPVYSEQEGWFQEYLLKTGFIVIPGVRERGDNCVLSTSCQLCHMILDESHDIKY